MKTNKNGVKLLAAIMVFAMAFAGITMIASESDAAVSEDCIKFYGVQVPAYESGSWSENHKVSNESIGNEFVSIYRSGTYYITGDLSKIGYGAIENFDWDTATAAEKAQYVMTTTTPTVEHYMFFFEIKAASGTSVTIHYEETGDVTFTMPEGGKEQAIKYVRNNTGSFTVVVGSDTYKIDYNFNLADSFLDDNHKTGNALDNGVTSGTNWSLSGKTLTLNGYKGNQYFLGDFTTVVLSGKNIINADTSGAATVMNFGAIGTYSALTIYGGSTSDSLTITQNDPDGYGISSYGSYYNASDVRWDSFTNNITVEKCTITVNDGCNRAFYGSKITIGDGSNDVAVTVTASEKSIRASSLDVKAKATVEALLSENINTNGLGTDDVFGIKTGGTITNAGIIKSQGLSAEGIPTNTGKIYVSGDYAQKPGDIAGFVISDKTDTTVKATRITQISESDAAGIYVLGNTMASSNVTVSSVDGTSETVTTKTTAGIQATINASPVAVLVLDANYSNTTTPINLTANKTLVIQTGDKTYTGEVRLGNNNKVMLDGVKGTFTISYGSVYIGGQFNAGTMTVYGDAHLENNTTIENGATLYIDSGATLKLEGFVLTNNGIIKNAGTIESDGSLVNNGIIDFVGDMGLKDTINTDTTITADAYLSGNLTIPEGVTLTVKSNAKLDMVNYDLIVKGTLVVENKGIITSSAEATNSIVLSTKGVIDNKGIIGDVKPVNISCVNGETAGNGIVTIKGLSGIEFGTVKVGTAYYLTVSGNIAAINKDPTTFEIDGAYISGDLSVKDVTLNLKNTVVLSKDSTLTIGSKAKLTMASGASLKAQNATIVVDGSVAGNVSLTAGSSVVINGYSYATYTAATGSFKTFNAQDKRQTAEDALAANVSGVSNSAIATDGNITGYTISVSTKAYTATDGVTPMTRQMLNIAGDAKFNYTIGADGKPTTTKAVTGTIALSGTIYVQAGDSLALLNGMTLSGTTYTIITDGTIIVPEQDDVKYKGAMYAIDVSSQDLEYDTVYYYTTFDNAYAVIDTVIDKTVTIAGNYTFSKEYTIKADQVVQMTAGSKITVGKTGTVTVESDGKVSGTFDKIKGVLLVMYGGDCIPAESSYEVKAVDADKNTKYSSAEVAIKNAEAGSTIYIVNAVTFEDPAIIPAGVTVDIADTASITAEKGLTVNGKIVNDGTITVNDGYNLVVSGEIESSNTIALGAGAGSTGTVMTVTGIITSVSAITISSPDKVNAAIFTNVDGEYVYTSISNAVALVKAMESPVDITVKGEFSEKSDIVLAEEMKLVIDNGAKIVVNSVKISTGSVLDVDGELTADVIASVGKVDTTGALTDAVVGVTKIKETEFTLKYSEAKTTYTMEMENYTTGKVVVKSGSVNFVATTTPQTFVGTAGNEKTLEISNGASFVIVNNITLKDNTDDDTALVNNGTIRIEAGAKIDASTIGGEVIVAVEKTLTLKNTTVVGTITLSTEANKVPAKAFIDTMTQIGSTPETLGMAGSISGDIDYDTEAYVLVYNGSTFIDTSEVDDVKSTKFIVNGVDLITVYTESNRAINTVNGLVTGLKDIDNNATITWFAGDVKLLGTENIGVYETVSATVAYAKITNPITVSAGPGLIVYVDDLKVVNGKVGDLRVGEHTITVYIEPAYEGTPVIKFNGVTITNGVFNITTDILGANDNLIVVTGATPSVTPTPTPIQPEKDDGMGLTDYLLIVLVILAAILVVVVAIRMMRS